MRQITQRLLPNQDLRNQIEIIVKEQSIDAGVILSAVGCLTKLRLRMSDGKTILALDKPFEIVACTGTVSRTGCHVHIAASDQEGHTIGGHLKDGCLIGTTAEIVILIFDDTKYNRLPDACTGYDELVVG